MRSRRLFLGILAIVFAASAAKTIATGASMAAMAEMAMPGGWTMSHMWMRMPGQTWLDTTASFTGMWLVMMAAMMLPSLTPSLLRYRESVGAKGAGRIGCLTALVGAGCVAVWAAVGLLVFPFGVALADVTMREPEVSRTVPIVIGATVLAAGALQHTRWKARQLAVCRGAPGPHLTTRLGTAGAWSHGLHLGLACVQSCAGLMAVALSLGIMDLRVMAAVTATITVERLTPAGLRVARTTGVIGVGTGVLLIARAIGIG
ncbi:MAG TPA: DUF2182 domain-containing protein [Gemmatimonadaceae bacterium]|nr:DUF2182 domain-containing protein [Gemmatimonadaceae bacterium]